MGLITIRTLSSLGFVLAAYGLYVELRHELEVEGDIPFVALCDIEVIGASCSNTFALPQSRLLSYLGIVSKESALNVPNTVLGLIYYGLLLLFGASLHPWASLSAASTAMGTSIFLAYTMIVLKELCILCWATHVINSLLLYKIVSSYIKRTAPEKKIKST